MNSNFEPGDIVRRTKPYDRGGYDDEMYVGWVGVVDAIQSYGTLVGIKFVGYADTYHPENFELIPLESLSEVEKAIYAL